MNWRDRSIIYAILIGTGGLIAITLEPSFVTPFVIVVISIAVLGAVSDLMLRIVSSIRKFRRRFSFRDIVLFWSMVYFLLGITGFVLTSYMRTPVMVLLTAAAFGIAAGEFTRRVITVVRKYKPALEWFLARPLLDDPKFNKAELTNRSENHYELIEDVLDIDYLATVNNGASILWRNRQILIPRDTDMQYILDEVNHFGGHIHEDDKAITGVTGLNDAERNQSTYRISTRFLSPIKRDVPCNREVQYIIRDAPLSQNFILIKRIRRPSKLIRIMIQCGQGLKFEGVVGKVKFGDYTVPAEELNSYPIVDFYDNTISWTINAPSIGESYVLSWYAIRQQGEPMI